MHRDISDSVTRTTAVGGWGHTVAAHVPSTLWGQCHGYPTISKALRSHSPLKRRKSRLSPTLHQPPWSSTWPHSTHARRCTRHLARHTHFTRSARPRLAHASSHLTNMNWSCARRTTRNAQAMHQPLLCGCTLSIFVAVNDLMLRSCGHACGICRYAKSAIAR